MGFFDNIKGVLDKEFNKSITENGAVGYKTTNNHLLDLNYLVSTLRNKQEYEICLAFGRAYFENKLLAIKWLFYAGDVRMGLGERRLFRICINFIIKYNIEIAKKLLPLIPEYTRWDNLVALLDTDLQDDVSNILKEQLDKDLQSFKNKQPITLLAKWLPSINTNSAKNREFAKLLAKKWNMKQSEYRKTLAKLRAYSKVIEVSMNKKEWSKIKYAEVPSRANLIYSKAFLKNDKKRRERYLDLLAKGREKINSAVLFPHDIVHYYTKDTILNGKTSIELKEDYEQMWKSLPDYVEGNSNTLCVYDSSGSMTITLANTKLTAMDVAMAMTIYFSERCTGEYKDRFLTFSKNPQIIDLSNCKTLRDKIAKLKSYIEIANTDIEAVFRLILNTAIQNNMQQKDLPQTILILSDMEFDQAVDFGTINFYKSKYMLNQNLFEAIEEEYELHGYKLPKLAFWNIASRTGTIAMKNNKLGVALVSGFSPTVVKMVLSNEIDPLKALLKELNGDRYKPVEDVLKDIETLYE